MLAAVGVGSVEELFRDIPAGVRLRSAARRSARAVGGGAPAASRASSRRGTSSTRCCFLGAGIYDHYVPAVVDAMLQRGELLTAYTPYQPEMSQGVLQAIFEYQTAICELTGMDVSNASGYDGTTVAADACFVAKHATGRAEDRRHRGDEPAGAAGREDLRAAASGSRWSRCRTSEARPIPTACAEAAADAAAVLFQQPNFFGCLEPAPELAAAANDAGALPIAHVDLVSLGVLEAPGNYGCAIAIGEGQSAGNAMSYGGPHYGFLASRSDLRPAAAGPDRRRDGRHRGRARLRARRCRRASSTSAARRRRRTSPPTRRCSRWRGWCTCRCSARRGCARRGRPAWRSPRTRRSASASAGSSWLFPEQATFKEFAVRAGRPATRGDRAQRARASGINPGYPLGRDYPGLDDALLVAVTEKRTVAEIDRLVGGARRVKLIYERSQAGPSRPRRAAPGSPRAATSRRSSPAASRRGCRSSPSPRCCATSPRSRPATSGSTRASIRSAPAR